MTSTPEPDARLTQAHDLALAALAEITAPETVGDPVGYLVEDGGAVSLRFENRMPGYPGWFWTVTLARVDDEDPTVLEVELLPGEGALLAPEWVPWTERLAEYRAHQAALAELAENGEEDDLDDEDIDGDDLDDDLDDEDADDILHSGDLDGVDIDSLDDSDDDLEDDEPDEDESDDEDQDDRLGEEE